MASRRNGTLYVGVTSDLPKRVEQHKSGAISGFTKKYRIHTLVHYEVADTMLVAIEREKQIKSWSRKRKADLIERDNLHWKDISESL
jgi:putative endonuclease